MNIYCTECKKDVKARLTSGAEVYPHRKDLANNPQWICDTCKNFVGTHHKSNDKTKPLGVIAGKDIKLLRQQIHAIVEPKFRTGELNRQILYGQLSSVLGKTYHTGEIRSVEEANEILDLLKQLLNK